MEQRFSAAFRTKTRGGFSRSDLEEKPQEDLSKRRSLVRKMFLQPLAAALVATSFLATTRLALGEDGSHDMSMSGQGSAPPMPTAA